MCVVCHWTGPFRVGTSTRLSQWITPCSHGCRITPPHSWCPLLQQWVGVMTADESYWFWTWQLWGTHNPIQCTDDWSQPLFVSNAPHWPIWLGLIAQCIVHPLEVPPKLAVSQVSHCEDCHLVFDLYNVMTIVGPSSCPWHKLNYCGDFLGPYIKSTKSCLHKSLYSWC